MHASAHKRGFLDGTGRFPDREKGKGRADSGHSLSGQQCESVSGQRRGAVVAATFKCGERGRRGGWGIKVMGSQEEGLACQHFEGWLRFCQWRIWETFQLENLE